MTKKVAQSYTETHDLLTKGDRNLGPRDGCDPALKLAIHNCNFRKQIKCFGMGLCYFFDQNPRCRKCRKTAIVNPPEIASFNAGLHSCFWPKKAKNGKSIIRIIRIIRIIQIGVLPSPSSRSAPSGVETSPFRFSTQKTPVSVGHCIIFVAKIRFQPGARFRVCAGLDRASENATFLRGKARISQP